MSGDMAPLDKLVKLKETYSDLLIYLDDAHGLGVMGNGGRGTADHFGLSSHVDFIMGTFSKALASIGGFIASDDEVVLEYLRHHSRALDLFRGLARQQRRHGVGLPGYPGRRSRAGIPPLGYYRKVHQGYEEIGVITRHSRDPQSFPFTSHRARTRPSPSRKTCSTTGYLPCPPFIRRSPRAGGNSHRLYEHPQEEPDRICPGGPGQTGQETSHPPL